MISPRAVLARFLGRPAETPAAAKAAPPSVRAFEGAAGGRRWAGFGETPSAVSAMHAGRATLVRRSRSLFLNNPLARSAGDGWVCSLVGTGIKMQSSHPIDAVREGLGLAAEAWTDEADADGRSDFYGLQALIALQLVRDGEAFVVIEVDEAGRLKLRVLDADMVPADLTIDLGGGRFVLQGVEVDAAGKVAAYHMRKDSPGLPFVSQYGTVRVPAERVCHVFRRDTAGQLRGVPWCAPVMLRFADYDAAVDAQLVRQKVAALVAGFVTSPEGTGDPMSAGGSTSGGVVDVSLEPGEMKILLPGQDVRFSEPAKIGAEAIDFLTLTRREIAAGFGLPAHMLDGNLSETSYSSIRAGLVEFRRRVEALQHHVVSFQLLRPVWRKWVTLEVLSGRIGAPDFARDPAPYLAASFVPPRIDWVDPLKDVEAEISAIAAGLSSRRQAVAARGMDVEALDREIAADRAREERLGLDFGNDKEAPTL